MRRKPLLSGAVAALVAATGAAIAMSGGASANPLSPVAGTASVTRGTLASLVSLDGTLTYRARSDGSPYSVVNQARGIYTDLPAAGAKVACGDVLYRVDDRPVLLLCGTVPAYRELGIGATGTDVRQLNQNLRTLGYDVADTATFTAGTQTALAKLQHARGSASTGRLALDGAVFLPGAVRIADVTGRLGGAAQPDADVLHATSDTLVVQVNLQPWQRSEVKEGDAASVTLPDNTAATGRVDRVGTVARIPEQNGQPGDATIPAFVTLDDPARAGGLDQAPVSVNITTTGVDDALSVPVTALVGKSGGGYAVEVVRAGVGALVPVTLGLFDTTAGRVQIDGDVHEGDSVVVPTS